MEIQAVAVGTSGSKPPQNCKTEIPQCSPVLRSANSSSVNNRTKQKPNSIRNKTSKSNGKQNKENFKAGQSMVMHNKVRANRDYRFKQFSHSTQYQLKSHEILLLFALVPKNYTKLLIDKIE